jgi:hypothetical protein
VHPQMLAEGGPWRQVPEKIQSLFCSATVYPSAYRG